MPKGRNNIETKNKKEIAQKVTRNAKITKDTGQENSKETKKETKMLTEKNPEGRN